MENLPKHISEKLCPWSLALTFLVLSLERVCPRNVGSWPWPQVFFESLALASNVLSWTPRISVDYYAVWFAGAWLVHFTCDELVGKAYLPTIQY